MVLEPSMQQALLGFLAFFHKFRPAFRAGNTNLSFSPGNAHLLLTGRAFVEAVNVPLGKLLLFPVLLYHQTVFPVQVPLIFLIAFLDVPGKNTEVSITQNQNRRIVKEGDADKHGNYHEQQGNKQKNPGQLIRSIASRHKLLQLLFHNNIHSF